MSAYTKTEKLTLARKVLDTLAAGQTVSIADAFQLREMAPQKAGALRHLKQIAEEILKDGLESSSIR